MLIQTNLFRLEAGSTALAIETSGGFNLTVFLRDTLAGSAGEVRWQRRPGELVRGFRLWRSLIA